MFNFLKIEREKLVKAHSDSKIQQLGQEKTAVSYQANQTNPDFKDNSQKSQDDALSTDIDMLLPNVRMNLKDLNY
jgi:hypothetical protein